MGGGLDLNLPLTLGCLWAIFCTDLVQDLEYQVRPYEVVPGQTERRASRRASSILYEVFREAAAPRAVRVGGLAPRRPRTSRGRMRARCDGKFAASRSTGCASKPKVKITGEFYLQTVEGDPNYNIHRWLEAEGARSTRRRSPSGSTTCCAWACSTSRTTSASRGPRGSSWARDAPVQWIYRRDLRPPAARARRPAARAAAASSSCGASPRPTSTAASTAARATCWSARRSGRTSRRRRT